MPSGQIASVTHYEREQLQRHIVAAFGAAAAAVTQNSPLSQRHGSLNDLWESSVVTSIEENKEGWGPLPHRFQPFKLNSWRTERKWRALTHFTATHQALALRRRPAARFTL